MVVYPLVAAAPNWAEKLTAFSAMVAGLGFAAAAAGVWVAVNQLKATRRQLDEIKRDRHVQVISDFGLRWDSEGLSEARRRQRRYDNVELCEKISTRRGPRPRNPLKLRAWRRATNAAEVQLLLRVPNYFEDIGLMVDCGALDIELVGKAVGDLAISEWGRWELAITEMRSNSPRAYSKFGKLVEQLRKLELD